METATFLPDKIKLLPEHLIDQIKAGEVIERPASLLKELIENAIDAHALKIQISIRDNGLELIAIEDDGDGMSFQELPFAFCRHATSKIEKYEDLYSLASYGFRGEALASVASSARVTCTSLPRPPSNGPGGKITFHGGVQKSCEIFHSQKSGTSFYIKDLFYNTPARFKFIKSKISEKNALKRVLFSFILTHPKIDFSIKWDDKEKIFYPPLRRDEDIRKRFQQLISKKLKKNDFHLFQSSYEGHCLTGIFSKTATKGNSGKQQYLFANNRIFNDLSLHRSIIRHLEKFWGARAFGHYAFFFTVPPSQIDVNVHPNKTHVKFFKTNLIYSLVAGGSLKLFNQLAKSCPEIKKEDTKATLEGEEEEKKEGTGKAFELNENLAEMPPPLTSKMASLHSNGPFELFYYAFKNIIMVKTAIHPNVLMAIKKDQLIRTFLQHNYKKFKNLDHQVTPLLICEVFDLCLNPEQIPLLTNLGLHCDLVNKKLMIRSIPRFLDQFPVREVVTLLLKAFENTLNTTLDQILCALGQTETIFFQTFPLSPIQLEEMLKSIQFNPKSDYPFLTKLTEEDFS